MTSTPIPVLIVGYGDIGQRVARLCVARGWPVTAVARSPRPLPGVGLLAADLDRPESLAALPTGGSRVLYFAPPPDRGSTDPRMSAFLDAAAAAPPDRIVYLSTSGVYGDRGGAWVGEDDMPDPQTDRGRRRLDAELRLRAFAAAYGSAPVVLRVGGIYGPGRLPVDRLRKGLPVLAAADCGFTNRVHAEDLAAIAVAAAERGQPGAIYNVSDNRPGTMTEYFDAVADRLGLPRPPQVALDEAERVLTPGMLSYLRESRRLDARKLAELGVTLRYPDLASGLASLDPEQELRSDGG
jgi:nucleoside-diphosphate-sugar epimerase